MSGLGFFLRFLGAFAVVAACASAANAQNLTWHIEQLYSNLDGNIQFAVIVEYQGAPNGDNQNSIGGAQFTSVHNDAEHAHDPGYVTILQFPNNLPDTKTAGRRFLIGTQGFADLGILTPDYVMENEFIAQKSGVLSLYKSINAPYDIVTYPALPGDGTTALLRTAPFRIPNLATNYAGATASVPATPPPGSTGLAVEYYYKDWDYYFITSLPAEIAVLDGGAFGGVWKRTGQTFNVWTKGAASTISVCRFFSTSFAPKSSHFYTPFPAECATVKTNRDWQFEAVAFFMQLADISGNCGAGTVPLYRLYNNGKGGAPNHRFTTSLTVFDQMIAAGWIFEGNGNTKVFACVPQ